jgi:hypothetical protein
MSKSRTHLVAIFAVVLAATGGLLWLRAVVLREVAEPEQRDRERERQERTKGRINWGMSHIDNQDRDTRVRAARELSAVIREEGPDTEATRTAEPVLRKYVRGLALGAGKGPSADPRAVEELRLLGRDAVPALVADLSHGDLGTRCCAVLALEALGPDAAEAAPALHQELAKARRGEGDNEVYIEFARNAIPQAVKRISPGEAKGP